MSLASSGQVAPPDVIAASLPARLLPDEEQFRRLWDEHPTDYREINLYGQKQTTRRWMQTYGYDYHFNFDRVYPALPMDPQLVPYVTWAQETVDDRLNGVLVSWYDAALGHYVGAHRDSRANLVPGSPIVMISFGDERVFRMRPWKGKGFVDFPVQHGSVVVLPYETNLSWTHEVPCFKKSTGRRISITLRAFDPNANGIAAEGTAVAADK